MRRMGERRAGRPPVMDNDAAQRLLSQALAGHGPAVSTLVGVLTPVIQARVARVLLARRPAGEVTEVRGWVEDLTQEVFLSLFADEARVLKSWRMDGGLSLENFVGLLARRRALSILRSGKGSRWREDPTLGGELDGPADEASPETRAASREQLGQLLRRLQEELSPLGWHLFELLYLREGSVEEVQQATGMSTDAIYAWRSRLRRLARHLLSDLVSRSDGSGRRTEEDEH